MYMQGVLQRRKASLGAGGQGRHFQKSLEATFKNGGGSQCEACTKVPSMNVCGVSGGLSRPTWMAGGGLGVLVGIWKTEL